MENAGKQSLNAFPRGLRTVLWPSLFGLLALEGLAAFLRLAAIPADPKNRFLFGYSLNRLAILLALLGLAAGFLLAGYLSLRQQHPVFQFGKKFAPIAVILTAAAGLAAWVALLYLKNARDGLLVTTYERLSPLLVYVALAALQVLLASGLAAMGWRWDALRPERAAMVLSGAIFILLLLAWVLVAATGLGITVDGPFWGIPGVPLLFYQLLAACAATGLFVGLVQHFAPSAWAFWGGSTGGARWDVLIAVALWLAAVVIWMQFPTVDHSYFSPPIRPPNNEIYPLSDAGFYEEAAQSIVIGEGFLHGQVLTRPLFILFLAGLNAAAGPSYNRLIFAQTLFLALFPVTLYFLGKRLHSRAAGLLIAILAVIREVNSISATGLTTVSNSKLILSDFPTALALSAITLLALAWLERPEKRPLLPLLLGGCMGLLMLIRSQAVVLAPFLLLLALPVYWARKLRWLGASALFALGLILAVTPWLWRNYQLTGKVMFDQPMQTTTLAARYSFNFEAPPQLPGEDANAYAARLMGSIRQFALSNPGFVATFTLAHFLNNEIQTALVLPVLHRWADVNDTLYVATPFWENWDGRLDLRGSLLLAANLLLIAIGAAAAWKRLGWAGLIPLVIQAAYSLSNAVARNSGWRYMLPADWVGYFYFAIGFLQLLRWVFLLAGKSRPVAARTPWREQASSAAKFPLFSAALLAAGILLAGASLPLSEALVPERYPEQSRQELVGELLSLRSVQKTGIDSRALETYAAREDVLIFKGRALFPRFYGKNQGLPIRGWPVYQPRDFSRLAFLVLNQQKRNVNLRMDKSPAYFPNTADVIVVGCQADGEVDPVMVTVLGKKDVTYLRSVSAAPSACPLPATR